MACWKCEACGATNCDVQTCTVCAGKGRTIKKQVHDEKLKGGLKKIGEGTYPCDADHKNFIREDI